MTCSEKESLVAYLYGECDAAERERVESHLAECAECAAEIDAFRGVRSALGEWAPPEQAVSFKLVPEILDAPRAGVLRPARWWRAPLVNFGRVAAAVLLFAAGLGLANLDVRYDGNGGLVIRTGWRHAAPASTAVAKNRDSANAPPAAPSPTSSPVAGAAAANPAPWRADLASLERQLREDFSQELATRSVAARTSASPAANEQQVLARVRQLIAESEQRQQRETAYRLAQFTTDFETQRQADLLKVQQGFGQIVGRTGEQRQLINYLLTVSQKK